jgi:hypothetical protein
MSLMDRIRELFGGKQTGAEYGTVAGGSAAATADEEPETGLDYGGGGDFSGGGDGGGSGGGGGGDGGGAGGT